MLQLNQFRFIHTLWYNNIVLSLLNLTLEFTMLKCPASLTTQAQPDNVPSQHNTFTVPEEHMAVIQAIAARIAQGHIPTIGMLDPEAFPDELLQETFNLAFFCTGHPDRRWITQFISTVNEAAPFYTLTAVHDQCMGYKWHGRLISFNGVRFRLTITLGEPYIKFRPERQPPPPGPSG